MDDGSWADYDDDITATLDDAVSEGAEFVRIPVPAWRNYVFHIRWRQTQEYWSCHVVQKNEVSFKVRSMRRIVVVIDRGD